MSEAIRTPREEQLQALVARQRAVLSRYQAGETVAALAADYGLPVEAVEAICTREDCWPLMDKARAKAGKRGRP